MAIKHIAHLALDKDPDEETNIPVAKDLKGAQDGKEQHITAADETGPEAHEYPAGMAMHITHEEMHKMGHEEPPAHGSTVHFEGHGRVTHVGDHPIEKGGHMVHVQITHMGMDHGGEHIPSHAERLYGKGGKEDEAFRGKETPREERAEAKSGKY